MLPAANTTSITDPSTLKHHDLEPIDLTMRVSRPKVVAIASFCGGGNRCIVTSKILEEIEKMTHLSIAETFDMLSGASSGALLALGLNIPSAADPLKPAYSAAHITNIIRDRSVTIFPNGPVQRILRVIKSFRAPRYSSTGIQDMYKEVCHDKDITLSKLIKPILVPAAELTTFKPWWFTKTKIVKPAAFPELNCENVLVGDLGQAACAAPTLFPAKNIRLNDTDYCFADGGVYGYNPTLKAYLYGREMFGCNNRFLVSSFGSGECPTGFNADDVQNAGLVFWSKHFGNLFLDMASMEIDSQLKSLLPGNDRDKSYFYFQPSISREDETPDDTTPEHVDRLIEAAKELIENRNDELQSLSEKLIDKYHHDQEATE